MSDRFEQTNEASFYGDCLTPDGNIITSSDMYISNTPTRSIKRARSTKDAYPPSYNSFSGIRTSYRRRSYLSARNIHGWKSNQSLSAAGSDYNLSLESSDSESLPDLSDTNSISESIHSALTPKQQLRSPSFPIDFLSPIEPLNLSLLRQDSQDSLLSSVKSPSVFDIPELVYKIIEFADVQNTAIPIEFPLVRRRPLSLHHANLLHDGNKELAAPAMGELVLTAIQEHSKSNVLHTCLFVNKLFNRITKEILGHKLLFRNEKNYQRFAQSDRKVLKATKPQVMVLSRLRCAKQDLLDNIAYSIDFTSLKQLEFYMCPGLKPRKALFHESLKSFSCPGSRVLDDLTLVSLAKNCPRLEVLDLRACKQITDYGIFSVGSFCHNLKNINLGRNEDGFLITDYGVLKLIVSNPNLHTVGLTGCHITDRTIWQLAMSCGSTIERLSLNGCFQLTNESIPTVLKHDLMPKLLVVEVRFIENLTDFIPILNFTRKQSARGISVIFETCETLACRLKACEKKLDDMISQQIYEDIAEWANLSDDDACPHELIRARWSGTGHYHESA